MSCESSASCRAGGVRPAVVLLPLVVGLLAGPARAAVIDCGVTIPPPASGLCTITAGSNGALLFRGSVATPKKLYLGAELVLAPDGTVDCAECDCGASPYVAAATRFDCANALATPGLIDALDPLDLSAQGPLADSGERYDLRHDWRIGQRGHAALPAVPTGDLATRRLAEARLLFSGVTSVVGGVDGVSGLVRNLDDAANSGLTGAAAVDVAPFPLADAAGTYPSPGSCSYPGFDAPTPGRPYWATASEGTDAEARNELVCLTDPGGGIPGSHDVLSHPDGVTFVHALAMNPPDVLELAAAATPAAVIWTPRSDLRLYGSTVAATVLDRGRVHLALGTNGSATGSADLLRELRCAADFNRDYLAGYFDDEALVLMATLDAAAAAGPGVAARLGDLARGLVADVVLWDSTGRPGLRALLEAGPGDVALVLRGGVPMLGDADLVAALGGTAASCDDLTVCGRGKRECARRDLGVSLTALLATTPAYTAGLFSCGPPPGEPTCVPARAESDGAQFSGTRTLEDLDGDGLLAATDLCPTVFDPPRPLNGNLEADFDGDGLGDACDPCPTAVDPATCGLTAGADLAVALSGPARLVAGRTAHLTATVSSTGGAALAEGRLLLVASPHLGSIAWSCTATPGSACPAPSGAGPVDLFCDLAPGGSVTLAIDAVTDPAGQGPLLTVVHAQSGELEIDPDLTDNSAAIETHLVPNGILEDGFESGGLGPWSAAFRLP